MHLTKLALVHIEDVRSSCGMGGPPLGTQLLKPHLLRGQRPAGLQRLVQSHVALDDFGGQLKCLRKQMLQLSSRLPYLPGDLVVVSHTAIYIAVLSALQATSARAYALRGWRYARDQTSPRLMELQREQGQDVTTDIFPIFTVEIDLETKIFTPIEFCGTGFTIAPELILTCWHCVRVEQPPNRDYAAVFRVGEDDWNARKLTEVSQDVSGRDLAAARVEGLVPQLGLTISATAAASGTDVWTYGYPMTERRARPEGGIQFYLTGRWLEGYITRVFAFDQPEFGRSTSYELDMAAPSGLSGAPIVRRPGRDVFGVVYAETEAATIEAFTSVDPETGDRRPEVQRVISFAVAHDTGSLTQLACGATGGVPLAEYLAGRTC